VGCSYYGGEGVEVNRGGRLKGWWRYRCFARVTLTLASYGRGSRLEERGPYAKRQEEEIAKDYQNLKRSSH